MGFIVPGRNNRYLTKNKKSLINENNIEKYIYFNTVEAAKLHLIKTKQREEEHNDKTKEKSNKDSNSLDKEVIDFNRSTKYNILNIPLDITLKIVLRVSLDVLKTSSKKLFQLTLISLQNNYNFYKEYITYHFNNDEFDLIHNLYNIPEFLTIFIDNIDNFFNEYIIDEDYGDYYLPKKTKSKNKSELNFQDTKWDPKISSDQIIKFLQNKNEKNPVARWVFLPFFINKMQKNPTNFFKFTFFQIYKDLVIYFLQNDSSIDNLFTPLYSYYIMARDYTETKTGMLQLHTDDYARFVELFIKEILSNNKYTISEKQKLFIDSVFGEWRSDGYYYLNFSHDITCFEQEKIWLDIYNLRFSNNASNEMKEFSMFMEQFLLKIKIEVKNTDSEETVSESWSTRTLTRPNIMHMIQF